MAISSENNQGIIGEYNMKFVSITLIALSFLLSNSNFSLATENQESESIDITKRIELLEARVSALEAKKETQEESDNFDTEEIASDEEENKDLVDVYLIRKVSETIGYNPYPNIVFDLEFVGKKELGKRRIKDIKGTVWFQDSFGDDIVGATTTERLNIGAGEKVLVDDKLIDGTTAEVNDKWGRVLTTDKEELNVRFEVSDIIFDNSVKLEKEQIQEVQALLNEKGLNAGTPDGKWGPKSRSALRDFQTQENLKPTGSLDIESLQALGYEM